MTQASVRASALTFSILAYSILDTLGTANLAEQLFPALDSRALSVVQILLKSVQLGVLLAVSESILLRIWARHILGKWAYHSESGNFGLAIIHLRSGELVYQVELYKTAKEVSAALDGKLSTRCFAQARSKVTKYLYGEFHTDYHIEYSDKSYVSRKGLLTLIPTLNSNVMIGHWYSTVESKDGHDLRTGKLDFLRKSAFRRTYLSN